MATVQVLIRGKRHVINLDDVSDRAGSGGEAVVKIINGEAVKIRFEYDPSLAGRLQDAPTGVPANAIMPQEAVRDANDPRRVLGFTMKLVEGVAGDHPYTLPISLFGDADFQRQHGLTWEKLVRVLLNLHDLVSAIHRVGIILGDFNEMNVLVNTRTLEVFMVDMDAAWWGKWQTRTFTSEFTDPRLLKKNPDPEKEEPVLQDKAAYTQETDWYSYAAIVCKVLLGGTPYRDGVHNPRDGSPRQRISQRVLNRVTFFDPSVRLSNAVRHPSVLPAGLGLFLQEVFVKDRRVTPFPRSFLETYVQTTCSCGHTHGRTKCPKCGAAGVTPPINGHRFGGTGQGIIISAAPFGEPVRYVTHYKGAYRREDGTVVLRKPYSPAITALVAGTRTVLMYGRKFAIVDGEHPRRKQHFATQLTLGRATLAANSRHVYWMSGDHLVRDDSLRGIAGIGRCVTNKTSVWTGERFGLVLVQEQSRTSVRTFTDRGFNGSLHLPATPGVIVGAECVIGNNLAWLKITHQTTRGRTTAIYTMDAHANLLATAEAQNSTEYLARLAPTALAVSSMLFVPVSGVGLVRYKMEHGAVYLDGVLNNLTQFHDTVGLCLNSTGLVLVSHTTLTHIVRTS